ncbi:hypothetical protein Fmac_025104 [Flemingia macrophylla]|uniref:NET2A-D/KIP1-like alpha-helical domain-containing protein n=1 Tax=Flemingia macrophylla TaxID=520843 RepID=A0ABD1LRE6_9FABA
MSLAFVDKGVHLAVRAALVTHEPCGLLTLLSLLQNWYWEVDEQIKELQGRVSTLQHEIVEGVVIKDDDARHLMAETALKSCQEALIELHEK